MKITSLWATVALFTSCVPAALAQATPTTASPTTATSATPTCTASLITRLCDYKEPGPEFAVAIESNASCWRYCDAHQPCNFAIFAAGNPYTGTGTCWLYPGEDFDKSAGNTDCGNPYLYVYSKPECAGGSPTSGGGACSATASPSAVASVCGYPPPEDCFYSCIASEGASSCLSSCAKADSCSYAVFNPHNPSNSPYASGTCWVYSNGTFDAGSTTPCSGGAEQFVYNNACPKPKPSLSPSSPFSSGAESSSSPSATASTGTVGVGNAQSNPTGSSSNSAPGILSPSNLWAVGGGMALFTWLQGLC
ncbi:hypothetical protein BU24DRAFT_417418 [Aaosphaeria arxii CBS 175.79]|uniref:Apple domain-containing protein n=1 Tax=Aaosphaeria arxii CBS 175.79 TaxID=1450172 RepID=A0A6A5Y8A1_9PLEO|nr:uncharacterized protein BU24DRAFT_417418 [Aaosphaeria arxii CBS 175.79]KAF2021795.1 hypothetical protein BU24DRAFT_417418 [Aaosphaeria arxii CBS 175.79]